MEHSTLKKFKSNKLLRTWLNCKLKGAFIPLFWADKRT